MSTILEDLKTTLDKTGVPFETGVWSTKAPDKYIVIVPLEDTLDLYGDNTPDVVIEEARLSLYVKGDYISEKKKLIKELIADEFTVTYMAYVNFETETKYHHFSIDVAKFYEMEN